MAAPDSCCTEEAMVSIGWRQALVMMRALIALPEIESEGLGLVMNQPVLIAVNPIQGKG
jgi:hypothetical protein